jgi:hypothetical protein
MKRSLMSLLFLASLSAGCGSSYEVGGPSGDVSVHVAASRLRGEEVTIATIDGHEYEGTILALGFYGVSYKPAGSDSTVRFPLTSLRSIWNPESRVGTAAPLGGLVGCVVGGVSGARAEEPPPLAFPPVLAGAGFGTVVGLGVGTIIGLTWADTYEFPQDEARPDSVANEKP